MEQEAAEDIQEILVHEEESAGGVMATGCIEVRPGGDRPAWSSSACEALADEVEILNQIYVLDGSGTSRRAEPPGAAPAAPAVAPSATWMTTDLVSLRPEASLRRGGRRVRRSTGSGPSRWWTRHNTFLGAVRLIRVLAELSGSSACECGDPHACAVPLERRTAASSS